MHPYTICEIVWNKYTNKNEWRNDRPNDRLDRQRYIIFDVFHRKFDVWKNGLDGFMHSAQLLAEKLPGNKKKRAKESEREWGKKKYIETVLKNVKGRNGLHACMHAYDYKSTNFVIFITASYFYRSLSLCLCSSVSLTRSYEICVCVCLLERCRYRMYI